MLTLKPAGLGQTNDYEVLDERRKPIGLIMWTHALALKIPQRLKNGFAKNLWTENVGSGSVWI
jgi:hypothetical protein